jgi:hypothetical protein
MASLWTELTNTNALDQQRSSNPAFFRPGMRFLLIGTGVADMRAKPNVDLRAATC